MNSESHLYYSLISGSHQHVSILHTVGNLHSLVKPKLFSVGIATLKMYRVKGYLILNFDIS